MWEDGDQSGPGLCGLRAIRIEAGFFFVENQFDELPVNHHLSLAIGVIPIILDAERSVWS